MKDNFDQCFDLVMQSEGGFVDDPRDPGGATNHGVTKAVWEAYIGHEVTVLDIKALTLNDVKPVYKINYWDAVKGDDLPSGIDYCVFDYAVNSGVVRAARYLQNALGVAVDGQIGPQTLAAANSEEPVSVIQKLSDSRLKFLMGLSTWQDFGIGWHKRVVSVENKAIEMVG